MKKNVEALFLLVFVIFSVSCNHNAQKIIDFKNDIRPSATPLVTVDPYFSIWSATDNLNADVTRHWTNKPQSLEAFLRVDGDVYRVMGTRQYVYQPIAGTSYYGGWNGKYQVGNVADNWFQENYNDESWKEGKGAFGSTNSEVIGTEWKSTEKDIYIRRNINLSEKDLEGSLYFHFIYDENAELYVNGKKIIEAKGPNEDGKYFEIEDKSILRTGDNLIACHCYNGAWSSVIDFGIFRKKEIPQEKMAIQNSLNVLPTSTIYNFTCGPVDLELTFTAPLLLDDLELLSRPVNYVTFDVKSNDGASHDVQYMLGATPSLVIDNAPCPIEYQCNSEFGVNYAKVGTVSQKYLAKKGDDVRIDWGYFYIASASGKASVACYDKSMDEFWKEGKISTEENSSRIDNFYSTPILLSCVRDLGVVENEKSSDFVMLAYDDVFSIQYFWQNLRPYWNRENNQTLVDQLVLASVEYEDINCRLNDFDAKLLEDAERVGGKEYADLCALAYRQAIAAHKLVEAPNGDLLFLSKENFSNGSIGTVDVTYPSEPLFLLYNPELAKGLLNQIFYYSESGRWKKPFAAHDVGTYPIANGQTYPGDMPVEENGNMIILVAAIAKAEGNPSYAAKHWETLTTWVEYLSKFGLDPEEQLCTDDFAGHFAHNTNLSVKAIVAIASYAKLAETLGYSDVYEKYMKMAKDMAAEWKKMAFEQDHYRLTFDREGSWSQKYNLVWDKLLDLNIFDEDIAKTEIAYYLTKQNIYGLPLDSRKTYTKYDWIIWTATMADNEDDFKAFILPICKFQNETIDRVPMSDWVYTDKPKHVGFRARSVVGGYFIKLLAEKFKENNN